MLSLLTSHTHTFCQMICPYLWHLISFSVGCKMVHAASKDAKMLSGPPSLMSVCHPLLPPYAVAQMLAHMFSAQASACLCARTVCAWHYWCVGFLFSFIEEYNTSIQEKLPLIIGSAAAGLVFLIAVVVIIIVCNRWVSPVTVFIKPPACTKYELVWKMKILPFMFCVLLSKVTCGPLAS